MSYTFQAPDPGSGNAVDFDFFDDPGGEPPMSMANSQHTEMNGKTDSDKCKGNLDKHDDVKASQSRPNDKHVSPRSESYSSDYSDTDSDSCYSDSCSDSDSPTPSRSSSVRKIEAKIPQVEPESARQDDTDERIRHSRSRLSIEGEENVRVPRPKTSLQKHRDSPRSHSYSSGSDHSTYTDSDTTTDSDTASDVTDVSPLHSPHAINKQSQQDVRHGKPPKSPGQKEVTFRSRPTSASSAKGTNRNPLIRADSDDIDLKLLMQAVMEMEQTHHPKLVTPGYNRNDSMLIQRHPTSADRKNFSFSNDNVRTIDKENQRLMQQIMENAARAKKAKKASKGQKKPATVNKMSTSAINRNREQMRIERENYVRIPCDTQIFATYNMNIKLKYVITGPLSGYYMYWFKLAML